MKRRDFVIVSASMALPVPAPANGTRLRVGCASSLRLMLPTLVALFEQTSRIKIAASYSASGILTRQTEQGAPFDVLLLADASHAQRLHELGISANIARVYAYGRCALVLNHQHFPDSNISIADCLSTIAQARGMRLAIANPGHAPYGRAAQEIIRNLGMTTALSQRLLIGENAAQATRYVSAGHASAAICPQVLATEQTVRATTSSKLIDAELHSSLPQQVLVTTRAQADASLFVDFLMSRQAQTVLQARGYDLVTGTAGAHG